MVGILPCRPQSQHFPPPPSVEDDSVNAHSLPPMLAVAAAAETLPPFPNSATCPAGEKSKSRAEQTDRGQHERGRKEEREEAVWEGGTD